MTAFLQHYRIRMRAVLGRPGALVPLLLYAGLSLLYWPGALPAADGQWFRGTLLAHWVLLWPLFSMAISSGRSTSPMSGGAFSPVEALPMLPVGPRARALAEASVALTFVFAVHLPSLAFGWQLSPYGVPARDAASGAMANLMPSGFLLAGAVLTLPLMVNWVAPGRGLRSRWLAQFVAVTGVLVPAAMGWLESITGTFLTGLILAAVCLSVYRVSPPEPARRRGKLQDPAVRFRPWMPPEARLRRDWWELLLTRSGVAILILIVLELVALVADQLFVLPEYTLYLASTVVFGFFFSYVLLRPMGDPLATAGTLGAPGFRPGDFARAWSVLPVRREALARGVYVHGLLCGGVAYGGILIVNVLATWRDTGQFGLSLYENSSSGWVLLPLGACVPCLVGFLTTAAMGDRILPYLCFTASIGVFFLEVAFHILGAPLWSLAIAVLALALFGALAPLRHMIASRPAPAHPGGGTRAGSKTANAEGCAT